MGPYNILAALQESFDRPRMQAVTNAKEYETEFGMKLGSLSVRVNKPEPPGFKQFDVLFLIRAALITPITVTIILIRKHPYTAPRISRSLRRAGALSAPNLVIVQSMQKLKILISATSETVVFSLDVFWRGPVCGV